MEAITVVLIDDDVLLREMLQALLASTPGIVLVGVAATGRAAIPLVAQVRPDVVLLDLAMPDGDGLQAIVDLARVAPRSRVLVLSGFDSEPVVLDVLRRGASGFLVKGEATLPKIAEAVRSVHRGEAVLSPRIAGWVLDQITG